MRFAAEPQFMFKHELRVRHVVVALGDLLELRREKRRVARVAEHAVLLIDRCGRLRLGTRGRASQD